MLIKETSFRHHQEKYKAERLMVFRPSPADSSRILVSSIAPDGNSEIIGNIYVENTGAETIYHGTTKDGNEVFLSTDDFNSMEIQFDNYAKLLITEREIKTLNNKPLQNNLTLNNLNQMKNSNNTIAKSKKENQLIFVEYEKPTKEGHLITVVDSYHNTIGRIHRSYNEQTKKYEFNAYDYVGKPLYMKSEKVWELKNQFTANRGDLLEQAHQRRIESKEQSRSAKEQTLLPENKTADRKIETGKTQPGKSSNEKDNAFNPNEREEKNQVTMEDVVDREDELDSIRNQEDGREDTIER